MTSEKEPDPESADATRNDFIPFPKSGVALLFCKMFEQFAYFGTKSVILMFLIIALEYSKDESAMIYHAFNMVIYVAPILGAIVSDSWLGRHRTILYLSSAYGAGAICMNLSSYTGLNLPARELFFVGLALFAVGVGTLKPIWVAFGGDQFVMPQQERQLARYFSIYYMTMRLGAFLAAALTPVLRYDVKCFGNDSCFPLAFGVPMMSMVCALLAFVVGSLWFVKRPASGNILFKVCRCIWHAAVRRYTHRSTDPKPHWLDHAEPRFGQQFVTDVKTMLSMLGLYLTFPMIFSLEELRGSRWIFQAMELNGDLGFYTVKPDQFVMVSPVLAVVMLNLWNWLVQPALNRRGMRIQMRFVIGAVLTVISLLIAGGLEMAIEPTAAVMPSRGECQVRIFNGQMCDFEVNIDDQRYELKAFDLYRSNIYVNEPRVVKTARLVAKSADCDDIMFTMNLQDAKAMSYFVNSENVVTEFEDSVKKDISGKATLRLLVSSATKDTLIISNVKSGSNSSISTENLQQFLLTHGSYAITSNATSSLYADITLQYAGVYTLMFIVGKPQESFKIFEISPHNSLSMLWLLPQYAVMALGMALFVVTCLHFAYTEAPTSMKAVLQAVWMLSLSAGNLVDVIIVSAHFFESQANEFFLFAGLAAIDIVVMAWLAYRYVGLKDRIVKK